MKKAKEAVPKKPIVASETTKYIPLKHLFIDPQVQRSLKEKWVDKLVRDFDPDLLDIISVSDRGNGTYAVIDGQHRVAAVRRLFSDDNQMVECKVYKGLAIHEEAARFVGKAETLGMAPSVKFIQKVKARDKEAVAIDTIVRECGYKIAHYSGDGVLSCVSSLRSVYRGFSDDNSIENPTLLRQTLTVIRATWGNSGQGLHSMIVAGIGRLIASRSKAICYPDLIARMASFPGGAGGILGRARGLQALVGGSVPAAVADVLIDVYNKGKRQNKIEPLRKAGDPAK